jgi:hypothetical protein
MTQRRASVTTALTDVANEKLIQVKIITYKNFTTVRAASRTFCMWAAILIDVNAHGLDILTSRDKYELFL